MGGKKDAKKGNKSFWGKNFRSGRAQMERKPRYPRALKRTRTQKLNVPSLKREEKESGGLGNGDVMLP